MLTDREVEVEQMLEDFDNECEHINTEEVCCECGLVVGCKHTPSKFGHLPPIPDKPRFMGEPVDLKDWEDWVNKCIADPREGLRELAESAGKLSLTEEELRRMVEVLEDD